ncbi:MFS transporter [Nocardioides insulae]|uniref:MFS transporter n=1 Tax=Nocardioides insulae TaxID=394734 RepID=UPI000402C97D|nr:MFS transporter [Nocardioides insulae]
MESEERRGGGVRRGLSSAYHGLGRAGRYTVSSARRAADAQGADASGLNRLFHLHTANTAGDAAVAIALAGSLFFQVPTDGSSSRENVALFLGLTMLPFAIVAPLIGPFLDRFAHGRRWAIGTTMAVRAFLCWVLAGALADDSAAVFPAALGVLVASKAYGVTRAAAVPRLLPESLTLVKTNGRVSMSGTVGVVVSAPIAGLASLAGSDWVLRWAFVLFVVATVLAIRLPGQVDSAAGEGSLTWRGRPGLTRREGRLQMRMPPTVAFALWANCGPRWFSGFLLMFMAFLLQAHPIDGWSATLLLAVVAGAAGAGNFIGVVAASLLRRINPAITVTAVLVADVVAATVGALFYGVLTLTLVALMAGLGQSLAKFSLDATIQAAVPEKIRASAFARSDTTLQLAWVIGGFVGIALPLHPRLGLGIAAVVLVAWAGYVLVAKRPSAPEDAEATTAAGAPGPAGDGAAEGSEDAAGTAGAHADPVGAGSGSAGITRDHVGRGTAEAADDGAAAADAAEAPDGTDTTAPDRVSAEPPPTAPIGHDRPASYGPDLG